MSKINKNIVSLLLVSASITSNAGEIAITFDDLPINRKVDLTELQANTAKLLKGLKRHNISVTAFVNEKKLYLDNTQQRIQILSQWITNGHYLGNHTYSHTSLHRVTEKEYEEEILIGEKITKKLMNNQGLKATYFRHPYLHTGTSIKSRNEINTFLHDRGYTVAPVTYDTDDWQFDREYVKALQNNENSRAQSIAKNYLEHTRKKFNFYKDATKTIFGHQIKQIWLLHANSINADNIDALINLAKSYDFSFISLDKALQDQAYNSQDDYYKDFGLSWLYRWDYSNGLKVDWRKEPEPSVSV